MDTIDKLDSLIATDGITEETQGVILGSLMDDEVWRSLLARIV